MALAGVGRSGQAVEHAGDLFRIVFQEFSSHAGLDEVLGAVDAGGQNGRPQARSLMVARSKAS